MANDKARYRSGHGLGREYRFLGPETIEVRDGGKANPDTIVLTGKPIMYDAAYSVRDAIGEFSETMHPGVVTDLITDGVDTRFLINHTGMPLARTLSGTLNLNDSPEWLGFTANLDARSQMANDLAVAIERGDVSQMSVGMVVARDKWSADYSTRDIYTLRDLVDVSAVTYPASPTTSIEVIQRMVQSIEETEVPWSDQVRMRKMWNIAVDLRAGKVLSAPNAAHVAALLDNLKAASEHIGALAEAGGVEAASDGSGSNPSPGDDFTGAKPTPSDDGGPDGTLSAPSPQPGLGSEDGAGSRSAFPTWSGPSLRATPPPATGAPAGSGPAPAIGGPAGSRFGPSGTPPKAVTPQTSSAKAETAHNAAAATFLQAAAAHAAEVKQQEADLAAAGAHAAAAAAHHNAVITAHDPNAATTAKAASKTANAAGSKAAGGWAAFDAARSGKK